MGNTLKIVLMVDRDGATHLETLLQLSGVPHENIYTLLTEADIHSFFNAPAQYDLLILDPDWKKGKALGLIDTLGSTTPTIFYCKNEKFAYSAFNYHSLDYLIRPVQLKRLQAALEKYSTIAAYWKKSVLCSSLMATTSFYAPEYKKRFLVRSGTTSYLIEAATVLCFYSENGRSFLVDQNGMSFSIDFALERLEELLDPKRFFRISRKVTVNMDQIDSIEDHVNHRLKIKLRNSAPMELIVSRKRVKGFKQWLRGVV